MDCIFCKIISGQVPSAKVYEDDDIVGFLDLTPNTKGHSLVVPKKHFENIFDADPKSLQKIILAGKAVAIKLKEALDATGINIAINNGKDAGQIVPHFHLHVIPKYENGQSNLPKNPSFEDFKVLAAKINK